jgi:hypothetical protein
MIHIFGDSHAHFSFRNLNLDHNDLHHSSITMFRIGRDNIIINFNKNTIKKGDTIVLSYGEVDCRCHIKRQINLGKQEDDIIQELVENYFKTIKNNIDIDVKIIVVGVIPPTKQSEYEIIHGPIQHEFPFVGMEKERVRYTNKVNKLLEEYTIINNYTYFNPYSFYTREDGTLKHELSDNIVHLGNNTVFLEEFISLYKRISNMSE